MGRLFWTWIFGPIERNGICVFIDFSFFGLFLSIGFLALFFIDFCPFFIDPFFERFLSNVASVGRFLFVKKPEKVEKSRKNDVFWGPKKRVKVGPFCTTPIFGQKSCFLAS